MSFNINLNLFIDNPIAAIVALFIGGGIMFGILGGLTGIGFFLANWWKLIMLGVVFVLIVIAIKFFREV